MAGIYGMVMGIANERQFGTLSALLATPANRLAVFSGRALPFILNGLVVSTFGFAIGWLLLDFSPEPESLAPARARRRRHGRLVHGARDADRLDRPAGARRLLRRQPRLLPDAALLRRQRRRRRAPRLDGGDRPRPPADARNRGGSTGRRRRDARRRRRPRAHGGADRPRVRRRRLPALPPLRGRGPPPGALETF